MLDSYIESQPYFVSEIKKLVNKGRISHAYLIETRNFNNANAVVLSFAKFLYCSTHKLDYNFCNCCNLCKLIDANANDDFVQLYPENSYIKKDQILSIKEKFMTRSFTENGSRIYIIYEADKMNKQAANSLLKFLEEPEDNVIAILVTENRYKVIDTIRSRCQIFSLLNSNNEVDFGNFDLTLNIIRCLEKNGRQAIVYLPILLEKQYFGREQWVQILKEIQYIYEQALRKSEGAPYTITYTAILDELLSRNSEETLLYKIQVIEKTLCRLVYNLNINLMLDDFIIKFSLKK